MYSNKSYNQADLTKIGAKLIFPFVKSIVEDISSKGGSVPISLKDIDFELVRS
ncbi:MAG: protein-export chaperone SecB [Candidatus Puniceispirillales bacterium]